MERQVATTRFMLVNAITSNQLHSNSNVTPKQLLAIFEAGLKACQFVMHTASPAQMVDPKICPATLRDLLDRLSAATESFFFRGSPNGRANLTMVAQQISIERGVLSTVNALHVALNRVASSAAICNPEPKHPVHTAAYAFDYLVGCAIVGARARLFSLLSPRQFVERSAMRQALAVVIRAIMVSSLVNVIGRQVELRLIAPHVEQDHPCDMNSLTDYVTRLFSKAVSRNFNPVQPARLSCVHSKTKTRTPSGLCCYLLSVSVSVQKNAHKIDQFQESMCP